MNYQEIKHLRRQIKRYINRAMHHLRASHSTAAYRDFQNAFEILDELIAR